MGGAKFDWLKTSIIWEQWEDDENFALAFCRSISAVWYLEVSWFIIKSTCNRQSWFCRYLTSPPQISWSICNHDKQVNTFLSQYSACTCQTIAWASSTLMYIASPCQLSLHYPRANVWPKLIYKLRYTQQNAIKTSDEKRFLGICKGRSRSGIWSSEFQRWMFHLDLQWC